MKNKKSLGQNWLTDRAILDQIANYAINFPESFLATPPELCLEIGPGLGTLTSALLRRFDRVIAVELDSTLAQNLPKSFPGKNLSVKNQDFLSLNLDADLPASTPYVITGNIPYYITTPILKHIFSFSHLPVQIVLLVQKEFAEKIATVSTPLGYYLYNLANLEQGITVPRSLFAPPPKVDSKVLILTPRPTPLYPNFSTTLAPLLARAFSAPRKKLASNLSPIIDKTNLKTYLTELHLSPDVRPADLSLEDYASLAKRLK